MSEHAVPSLVVNTRGRLVRTAKINGSVSHKAQVDLLPVKAGKGCD